MSKMKLAFSGMAATAMIFCATLVAADAGTIAELARITMSINHFPSDDDKAVLTAIIESDDSNEEEATIAMALVNLQHKVTEGDAERLQELIDDDTYDEPARKLANILLSFNHAASDEDKLVLASLAGE